MLAQGLLSMHVHGKRVPTRVSLAGIGQVFIILVVLFSLIGANAAPVQAAGTAYIDINATADTWMNGNSTSTNYGTNATILQSPCTGTGGCTREYSLLKFDLTGKIPAGAVITGASLRLFVNSGANSGSAGTFALYDLAAGRPWVESEATYNNWKAGAGGAWSTAGAQRVPNDHNTTTNLWDQAAGSLNTTNAYNMVALNASGLAVIRGWITTPANNNGFSIQSSGGGSDDMTISSKEGANPPQLRIFYNTYAITASAGANGSVTPAGATTVWEGTSQTYAITPNTGYDIQDVKVDNVSQGAITSYTFSKVVADHTIAATFVAKSFTITPSAGSGGTISPATAQTVTYGSSQTFTITPNTGYNIQDVKVDNVSQGAIASYTFNNVTANHTIAATFAIKTFTVTPTVVGSGTVSPATPQTVNYGANLAFTFTPNAGYHISQVLVDGSAVTPVPTAGYTFTNVQANHAIQVTFAIDTFTITPSVVGSGTITPATVQTVNYGADLAFTFTPAAGYHISEVLVDGAAVTPVPTTGYTFTSVKANHAIQVTFAIDTFIITPSAGSGGAISPATPQTVNYDADLAFIFTPNNGYHVSEVLVDGSAVTPTPTTGYTFTNVQANHTIQVTFAIDTFTITPSAGSGGTISPATQQTVDYGADLTFTITPDTGYDILDVKVDGVSQGAVTSYAFSNVTASHTIAATFALKTFTITPTVVGSGTISPATVQTVDYGTDLAFTFTPAVGHHVAEVLVDGTAVTPVPTTGYTFTNVTANHAIQVTFAIDTFTITPSAGANGSISPSSAVVVSYGGSQTFTITPSTGYDVLDVKVDNVSQGAVTSYTFSNVQANHTIAATFAIKTFTITPSAIANGSISPATQQTVDYGADLAFIFTPSTGYHVSEVLVDGSAVTPTPTTGYTFTNVQANHTIQVTFAIDTFTVTPSVVGSGAITPATIQTVNYGADQAFTFTPSAGYHVSQVLVDGSAVTPTPTTGYTFTSVKANHTIQVTFAIDTFTISPSAGSGGAISPATAQTVNYGGSLTFTITPDTGYDILDVKVDGVSQGAVTSYTFSNIQANHTIAATFAIKTFTITPSVVGSGSVSPATVQTVDYGADLAFAFTPAVGHHVSEVLVDGAAVNPVPATGYTFNNVTANHTIQVTFAIDTFPITVTAGTGGAITPAGTAGIVQVDYGANQTFTITPNTGYHLVEVLVDGSPVTPAPTSYTFENVTAAHTIAVTFAIDTFTITPTAGTNGAISPATAQTVDYGSSLTFTFTPNSGYHVSEVLVDGSPATPTPITGYTFENVQANHTIQVTFAIDEFTITVTQGENGTISPAGVVGASYGDTLTFTIAGNTGYHVTDVLVDGASVGAVETYTFKNITANHTITATFAINTYTINASAGANGSISPSGAVVVNYGIDQAFTITPASGYHVADVLVDGTSVGAQTSYTFTKVAANHTIAASFAANTVNAAPVITEGASVNVTITKNGAFLPFKLTLHATDANGDTLTWSVKTQAGHGSVAVSGTGASKDITFAPSAGYVGKDSFVIQVSDGNGGTAAITVNVTVKDVQFLPMLGK